MADKNEHVLRLSRVLSDALRLRDAYTRLHSDRVMALSQGLGKSLGLSSAELTTLEIGSCLHDVGKIVVPDSVLMKPSMLDTEEIKIMRTHPEVGAALVAAYEHPYAEEIALVIRHHHEWFDGSGYPGRLSGEAIPLLSRIVTVVDNYDAMALRRVYQDARKHADILRIMESEAGSKLDPLLMTHFVRLIAQPEYAQFLAQ